MNCLFSGTIRTNLLTTGSASPFILGRKLASTLYGSEKNCNLIGQRLRLEISIRKKKNKSSPTTKEALFKEYVVQSFPLEMTSALREAVCGANGFGADM